MYIYIYIYLCIYVHVFIYLFICVRVRTNGLSTNFCQYSASIGPSTTRPMSPPRTFVFWPSPWQSYHFVLRGELSVALGMEHRSFGTVFWLKRQNRSGKHNKANIMPKRRNGKTAKRETENGRNGRDNHP